MGDKVSQRFTKKIFGVEILKIVQTQNTKTNCLLFDRIVFLLKMNEDPEFVLVFGSEIF